MQNTGMLPEIHSCTGYRPSATALQAMKFILRISFQLNLVIQKSKAQVTQLNAITHKQNLFNSYKFILFSPNIIMYVKKLLHNKNCKHYDSPIHHHIPDFLLNLTQ